MFSVFLLLFFSSDNPKKPAFLSGMILVFYYVRSGVYKREGVCMCVCFLGAGVQMSTGAPVCAGQLNTASTAAPDAAPHCLCSPLHKHAFNKHPECAAALLPGSHRKKKKAHTPQHVRNPHTGTTSSCQVSVCDC